MKNQQPQEISPAVSMQSPISINQLKEITSYFPIGDRVRYYPEYQPQMTMESLVLGYEINGHNIYSKNHLEILTSPEHKGRITLLLDSGYQEISKIRSFCILVPGKAGEEYKLDFLSKASLGSRGQFRNGNAITLLARYQNRGAIMVETRVRESIIPKEGYYRNHQLAMLEVLATSLEISEQRTHHRLLCNLPVALEYGTDPQRLTGLLVNYSEVSMKIQLDPQLPAESVFPGNKIVTTITLDHPDRSFVVRGNIMKCQGDNIIVSLEEILSDGKFYPLQLMQALDIKASLLQYPGIG